MSTLFVYVILICKFILVQSNTSVVKRFLLDNTLNGHMCQDDNVIFKVKVSKIACSVKCLEFSSCSGIFYDLASKQCTGCASTNGVSDITQQQYRFYKLEGKGNFIFQDLM